MKLLKATALTALFLTCHTMTAAAWAAPTELSVTAASTALQHAEDFKLKTNSARLDCDVELYENGQLVKTRQYQVYNGANQQSLVLFRSSSEAGQKVLMSGSDYWLAMPKSRRPLRITPMQKLLGEASLGDIATLSWTRDYQLVAQQQQAQAVVLTLQAVSTSASYQKIELTLGADHFPQQANLYLRSGSLAKVATFERGQREGRDVIVAMKLSDALQNGHNTLIRYQHVERMNLPDRLFNPQALLRADLEQLIQG